VSADLIKFSFEGHDIEAMPDGDNADGLFDAMLVAKALGFANPRKAIRDHVDPEDVTIRSPLTKGGKQKKKYLKEPGLWALALRANTEAARRFRRFVTAEVLPAIRRFGRYEADLQVKIAAYIGEHLAAWSMMFPREFWEGLDRLYGVRRADTNERPLFYAQCVQLVYDTMDPEVYAAMKLRVPEPQKSGVKQHQALSPFGREQTMRHVWRCIGHMDSCTSGPEWKRLLRDVYGRQQRLPLKGAARRLEAAQ
jgi:prophage antirepressor-like protein